VANRACLMCGGTSTRICAQCADNLRCLDAAQVLGDADGVEGEPWFEIPVKVTDEVPPGEIVFAPRRETLEKILEKDPNADLRQYFGRIYNVETK